MRLLGEGELSLSLIKDLVKVSSYPSSLPCVLTCAIWQEGETYARQVFTALNWKLKDEDLRRNQKARDRFAARR